VGARSGGTGCVTPDYRAALLLTAQALPPGTALPVPREMLLELLTANAAYPALNPERMLTAEEVAKLLGTTDRWVYAHSDQLGGKHLSRRCLRFPESAIRRRIGHR
jgi:predicted DNA-binding transcriptional regulator AlpA